MSLALAVACITSSLLLPKSRWFIRETQARVTSGAEKALFEAGSYVLEEANRTVPFREGVLAGSGEVESDDRQAVISYDTPYAQQQHEDVTIRHTAGRRAKWLEMTVREQSDRIVQFIAEGLRGALR